MFLNVGCLCSEVVQSVESNKKRRGNQLTVYMQICKQHSSMSPWQLKCQSFCVFDRQHVLLLVKPGNGLKHLNKPNNRLVFNSKYHQKVNCYYLGKRFTYSHFGCVYNSSTKMYLNHAMYLRASHLGDFNRQILRFKWLYVQQ